MAVNNTQYLSFLGGLVSPRLWLRSDMDKFGKWFATAENIRFHTVGSFENRFGTIKIGNTYRNTAGENIKLIKFDFGQGETCLLELGSGYFRVIADGKYILDENDDPLVFNTQIELSDADDIKYVQSGDIIFLTNSKGIYEIKRKSKDFTEWEVVPFEFTDGIVPYGDENDNSSSYLSASAHSYVANKYYFSFTPNTSYQYYENHGVNTLQEAIPVSIKINSTTHQLSGISKSYQNIVDEINTILLSYNAAASLNGLLVTIEGTGVSNITSIDFSYKYYGISIIQTNPAYIPSGYRLFEYRYKSGGYYHYWISNSNNSLQNSVNTINSAIYAEHPTAYLRLAIESDGHTVKAWNDPNVGGNGNLNTYPDQNYCCFSPTDTNVSLSKEEATGMLSFSSSSDFFKNKIADETFMVRNIVAADYIHATKTGYTTSTVTTETSTPPTIKSNGFWRYNSSGLWSGEVKLEYSTDSGLTWTTFFTRKNSVHQQYSTTNDNTSGNIKTDGGTVLIKMIVSNIDEDNDAKFSAELAVDKFEINSVYKISYITSNNSAVCVCVKGDIGEFTNNSHWREAEFSNAKGYPTAIGFYQNRLFLGKEYKLYSSRINDFWDFYEPIEVADDDPMTMSLLSYKVNNIQNLIGIRSFFVFTSGGEFGIGAEGGALTQATKYLKQISAHGSNSCNPIFCGDIIVFVDKTNNTVRAFRYSLESDGWEATDVSVLIEQVLEGKKIITTEYMQDTKECLFLTDEGEVYVFKFFQEQNIAAWSVWKHAKYKITNLCVLEDSLGKDILYIAVNTDTGMQIEQFNPNYYCDSVETFSNETEFNSVTTTFQEGDEVVVNDGIDLYLAEVGENGVVSLRNDSTYATVGLSYTSTATLLSTEIQDRDGTFSTFNRKRPFKVHCFYRNSYGFKVGVEEENKQEPQWQPIWSTADEETDLTTGKTSVLIPARYDGSSRVSFVQEKPYPMIIENVLLETDYGGK